MIEVRGGFGREMNELQREMERFLGHLSQGKRPLPVTAAGGWMPAVDVYETAEEVVVLVDAAGVKQDELQAVVDGRSVLIRGQRLIETRGQCRAYHQLEIGYGEFARVVELPKPVDPERAVASYQDGFLEVILPKVSKLVSHRVSITPQAKD